MSWNPVAKGTFASKPSDVDGEIRVIRGTRDIVALMKDSSAADCIAVTNAAGGTTVSTIIKRTKAIVSTIGGPNSHIVVVARDFGVPCIVGAGELDLTTLKDGDRLRLTSDGGIELEVATE